MKRHILRLAVLLTALLELTGCRSHATARRAAPPPVLARIPAPGCVNGQATPTPLPPPPSPFGN